MDIIKAKPISTAAPNVALNIPTSGKPNIGRGQNATNLDEAKYVLCVNDEKQTGDSSVDTGNGYVQITTSDLALPTVRGVIQTKTNALEYTITSTSAGSPSGLLNKVVRRGVGILTDSNGANITVTAATNPSGNAFAITLSAPFTTNITIGKSLYFGDITGSIKSSLLLPPRGELIVEKEPTDLIYGSNGINGNSDGSSYPRIIFTKVNRIRID